MADSSSQVDEGRPVMERAITADVTGHRLCRRAWWVFLIGGVASVGFGIVALLNPDVALVVMASFFAAAMLVDGTVNVAAGIRHRNKDGWWTMLLVGVAGVVVGGYALMNPGVTMAAFVIAAAFMAVVLGIALLTLGYKVRKHSEREWVLYLAGGLSLLFGSMIFVDPREYGPALVLIIASWALVIGALRIWFAFRIRGGARRAALAAAA